MSLYLGKIHYWLFNKILWLESLEEEIIKLGDKRKLPVTEWKSRIYTKYGFPTEKKSLENIIDKANIHGWLQNRISLAEKRHAVWITNMLNENILIKEDLRHLFENEGRKSAIKYRNNGHNSESPEDIYNAINDFILEGMPCDRVNNVINNNKNEICWETTKYIHDPYWQDIGGDISNFYNLRDEWIRGFVQETKPEFYYFRMGHGLQKIAKK